MKVFRIMYECGNNPYTLNFNNWARKVETEINTNAEIIESAKKSNREFFEKIRKICENTENAEFFGTMVSAELFRHPRFLYVKNLEYNGKEYEAEIDALKRTFQLLEV